jgi:hypothetical protein
VKLEDLANVALADLSAVAAKAGTKARYGVTVCHVRLVLMALLVHGVNGRRPLNGAQLTVLTGVSLGHTRRIANALARCGLVRAEPFDRAAGYVGVERRVVRWVVQLDRLAKLAAPARQRLTAAMAPLVPDKLCMARRDGRNDVLVDARVLDVRNAAMDAFGLRPEHLPRLRPGVAANVGRARDDLALAVVERMLELWRERYGGDASAATLSQRVACESVGLDPTVMSRARRRKNKPGLRVRNREPVAAARYRRAPKAEQAAAEPAVCAECNGHGVHLGMYGNGPDRRCDACEGKGRRGEVAA